ncbi:MAG: GTP 3',8-cyclase MoaA [Acidiferrobacterales bacterium]|nr:GTP 3',8-cyclase MoaA [Acidiferrobacterales bacterium]
MPQVMQPATRLVDRFGRHINYVRLSVTDRCDLRCIYCMNEKMTFLSRDKILGLEEMLQVGRAFTELGVKKIRITGGEPLVRKNVIWLFSELSKLSGLDELVLSTNGQQLERWADLIREAGVRRVNISLDSLDPERFHEITRVGNLEKVLRGVDAAIAAGFDRVKINSVVMKQRNHTEVIPLVRFAIEKGIDNSFIEEMPLGIVGDHDRQELFCSSDEIRAELAPYFDLVKTSDTTGGPSRYYRIKGSDSRVGFISPHSHNFCDSCNRVRVTTEGRLLLCLGQEHSIDLKRVLRDHPDDQQELKTAILKSMELKPLGHEFNLAEQPVIMRHMNMTGG